MKKRGIRKFTGITALMFVCILLITSCGITEETAVVEVKNGWIDMSVVELEEAFNADISDEYSKATMNLGSADETYSYYFSDLDDTVKISLLSAPDASMIKSVEVSCDPLANVNAAKTIGYYYAQLIYAVAPDITSEEISKVISDIDLELPLPGDVDVSLRSGIIYSLQVDDDGTMHLGAMADE